MSANVRLRWEYWPGRELFAVCNEHRDTLTRRFPDLTNRAFIVNVNRLLRFEPLRVAPLPHRSGDVVLR